jgi:phosphonate transport system ATP-binding protein
MSAVLISNLEHSYTPDSPVLKGVSVDVATGEIVGLIGLSGAGKSTLLRCINGLITPTSGSCMALGADVTLLSGSEKRLHRRRIGMIFQEFNLVDRLSVMKNVLVGRLGYTSAFLSCFHIFSKKDIDLAKYWIDQVGLSGYEKRNARDLSGGQKQRVAIARAMAQGAEIILADEATANLDVLTKDEIMDLLQGLARKQNATLILSMHDLPLAKRYCTRILGLKDGRITFDSTPEQLNDSAVADVLGRHIAG